VRSTLLVKLLYKNYTLLHAGCISKNHRGMLMIAPSNTGKTLTILDLLRDEDSRYLSDDMIVLGRDCTAYAYPSWINLEDVHLPFLEELRGKPIDKNLEQKLKNLFKMQKISQNLQYFYKISPIIVKIYEIINGMALKSAMVDIYDLIGERARIIDKESISTLFFLEKGNKEEVINITDENEVINRLYNSQRFEFKLYEHPYFLTYSYADPRFRLYDLFETEKKLFGELAKKTEVYMIVSRSNFAKHVREIN
jgi:hypothetical protein